MKQTKTLFALLALLPLATRGQTAVVTTGGTAESATHHISYSIGQIAVGSDHTVTFQLNEGVVQPFTIEEVGIAEWKDESVKLKVFPNPTTMSVTLRREDNTSPVEVRLYTLDGRLLHTEQWDGPTLTLDLNAYAAGVYMLQLNNNRTLKIAKQ